MRESASTFSIKFGLRQVCAVGLVQHRRAQRRGHFRPRHTRHELPVQGQLPRVEHRHLELRESFELLFGHGDCRGVACQVDLADWRFQVGVNAIKVALYPGQVLGQHVGDVGGVGVSAGTIVQQ